MKERGTRTAWLEARIAAHLQALMKRAAELDVKRLVANCFVVIEVGTEKVAGFYTLAAASVPASELPADIRKRLPRYPVLPAALIGRLAADRGFRGQGLGSVLLADAALRVINSDTKACAVIVEGKDDDAIAFYRHHGFTTFASRPKSLFLSLGTAKQGALG